MLAAATPLGAGLVAGLATAALLLFGPPGGDQAAHLYLTQAWRDNGWQLWDNLWYSGRYAQVNYSLIFYPFAALAGTTFAVASSCAGAAAAFAALLRRRWPSIATGPAVAFALLVPLGAAAGTYPFLMGLALALGTLLALQAGHRGLALGGVLLTALAHPLALAFLIVALVAVAAVTPGWWRVRGNVVLAGGTGLVAGAQGILLRGFPADGARYPFDPKDALAIAGFCVLGLLLTRGLPDQRPLRAVFIGYGILGAAAFALSSPLGGNAVRLMLLMGVPLLLLPFAARGFRPRGIAVACLAVALMWQALPAVAGWRTAADSRAQDESFWYPVIGWLQSHPDPNHRVQVVATADNWEAYYLARRGVPWPAAGSARTTSRRTPPSTATSRRAATGRGCAARASATSSCPTTRSTTARATRRRCCDRGARGSTRSPRWAAGPSSRCGARRRSRRRPTASRSYRSPRPTSPCACAGPAPIGCGCATRRTGASRAAARAPSRGSRGAPTCASTSPGSCASGSTYGSAPSWGPSSAARVAARAPRCPRRPLPPPAELRLGRTLPGGPTAAPRATSRARCGNR